VTYGYDGAGNRTSQSDCSNGSCVNSTWVYNQFNQVVSLSVNGVTTTYSHDRDGNRVGAVSPTEKSSFEWNAEGKLTNAWVQILQAGSWVSKDGKAEAYQYDSMGRRTKTYTLDPDIPTYPVATHETVYGQGWQELQKVNGANTSNPTTTDLLSIDGGLVPRKLASYRSGGASYFQLDALGSGRAVTGAGGAVQGDFASFGDFGKTLSTTDQPLTPSYTGYEHDAYTGLEYAKNRYYDPQTASFISSDPYPVDPSDLLGMNLYNYVQGNPVNSTDPLGWFVIYGINSSSQDWLILTTASGVLYKNMQKGLTYPDSLRSIGRVFRLFNDNDNETTIQNKLNNLKNYSINNRVVGTLSDTDPLPLWKRLRVPFCKTAECNQSVYNYLVELQHTQSLMDYSRSTSIDINQIPGLVSTPTATPTPTNPPTSTPTPTNPATSTPTTGYEPPQSSLPSPFLSSEYGTPYKPIIINAWQSSIPSTELNSLHCPKWSDINNENYGKHCGIDLKNPDGSRLVYIMYTGTVVYLGDADGDGIAEDNSGTVTVKMDNGLLIDYTHMDYATVRIQLYQSISNDANSSIKVGSLLGKYQAGEDHLHITIKDLTQYYDPANYVAVR
jgi:RHS repeat-associated protein